MAENARPRGFRLKTEAIGATAEATRPKAKPRERDRTDRYRAARIFSRSPGAM
jgi:hypothetical protein